MKISTPEDYRKALDEVSELRSSGATVESDSRLAELEGAIAAYTVQPEAPDESKGKPTADPYEKE